MARILMGMWRPSSGACHIESELTEPSLTDREPRTGTVSGIDGTGEKLNLVDQMKKVRPEQVERLKWYQHFGDMLPPLWPSG